MSLESIKARYQRHRQEQVKEDLKALFWFAHNAGHKFIMTKGTTPYFNDGDPCTHSQVVFVGTVYGQYECPDTTLMPIEFDAEEDEDSEEAQWDTLVANTSDCKVAEQVMCILCSMSNAIYEVYDTNTSVCVKLNSEGDVVIVTEHVEGDY